MESIVLVLVMLLAVVASGFVVRVLPFALPLPLAQIALGALIAGAFNHGVALDPEVFFLLFLPPLLFLDGWRIPKDGLFRDMRTILALALGLVLFTVVGAGLLIHWMIPAMPVAVAFALAAILSPTDPVAVSAVAARVAVPKRLMHILEGESLLNDASGLVCFRFAVAAALTGRFSLAAATLTFFWMALIGLALGVAVTLIVSMVQHALARRFGEEGGSPILISLLIPFGAYLLAERLHASGILAAVAAGITMSYAELRGRVLATTRVQRTAVWSMVQFALNGIMFVLLGEQLPDMLRGALDSVEQSGHVNPWWLAAYAVAIAVGLALLRLAWVWVAARRALLRFHGHEAQRAPTPWRLLLATTLAGVRGVITLAGVLTLPQWLPDGAPLPARDLAVFLATCVILLSLLAASFGLPRLLADLPEPLETSGQRQEDHARHAAAVAAIAAIENAQRSLPQGAADAELQTLAAARVLALYRSRLGGGSDGETGARELRRTEEFERTLRLAGLQAEREAVFELTRRRRLADDTARKLVREIDLIDARYRQETH